MNYQGNEQLRADISALAAAIYDLRERMRDLESRYFYSSSKLAERFAGQLISQMNEQVLALYKQANKMDHAFQD